MKISTAIIGLGKIGLTYDYNKKNITYLSHSSTINNHKKFSLTIGIDKKKKNRDLFEKKFKKKTFSSYDLGFKNSKIRLIIFAYDCQNIYKEITKIIYLKKIDFFLFEKPFVKKINTFKKIKKILIENKINFRVNFQRSFNKLFINNLNNIFKIKGNKKIIINYTGKFYLNGIHYLFLITPYIKNIRVVKKNEGTIFIKSSGLEIHFNSLPFNYSFNKVEIYTNKNLFQISGREEKIDIFQISNDKVYEKVKILKKKKTIKLNSKKNQKIVMDKIANSFNNLNQTKKFCILFEKYLKILNMIN